MGSVPRYQRVVALDAEEQVAHEAEQSERAAGELVFPDSAGGYIDDHNLRSRTWTPLLRGEATASSAA